MADKQVIDWIKSEESQGYTEPQIKDYLLKKGYAENDIEDAIISSRPTPIVPVIAFFAAFAFLVFFFAEYGKGAIILAIIAVFYLLAKRLHAIHNHITFILLYCLECGIITVVSYEAGAVFAAALLASIYRYYKLKKQLRYINVFLAVLTSMTCALAISALIYLALAYTAAPALAPMTHIQLAIIYAGVYFAFSICYRIFCSQILLKMHAIAQSFSPVKSVLRSLLGTLIIFIVISIVLISIGLYAAEVASKKFNSRLTVPSNDQLIQINISEYQIASELNAEFRDLLEELPNQKITVPEDLFQKIKWVNDGNAYYEIAGNIGYLTKITIKLSHYAACRSNYIFQRSEIMAGNYFDNATTIEEHITKTKDSINQLRSTYETEYTEKLSQQLPYSDQLNTLLEEKGSVYSKTTTHLMKLSALADAIIKLQEDLIDIKTNLRTQLIDKMISEIDKPESAESKAIRVSLLQIYIAGNIVKSCEESHGKDCYTNMYSIMKQRIFCRSVRCLSSIAASTGNYSVCDYALSNGEKETCYKKRSY